jgi:glycerol kinase
VPADALAQMEYSDVALKLLDIPRSILPTIKNSVDDFGTTLPDLFGLPIPIRAVVADQQSALFAEGCTRRGDTKITMGTGLMVNISTGAAPQGPARGTHVCE